LLPGCFEFMVDGPLCGCERYTTNLADVASPSTMFSFVPSVSVDIAPITGFMM